MRDEHLIYADIEDEKIKITPEEGYRMFCKLTRAYMTEAIVTEKEIKYFVAEEDER